MHVEAVNKEQQSWEFASFPARQGDLSSTPSKKHALSLIQYLNR